MSDATVAVVAFGVPGIDDDLPDAAGANARPLVGLYFPPWEACLAHFMDGRRVDALFAGVPANPVASFSRALVEHYRGIRKKFDAPDHMLYVDPLAAAVALDPSMITKSVHASSSVALAPGITRGMTLVDPSGRLGTPKITFVEQVDVGKVDALYAVSVAYVPTSR